MFQGKAAYVLDNLPLMSPKSCPQSQGSSHATLALGMITREVSEWEERLLTIRSTLQTIIDTIHGGGILTSQEEMICCFLVGNTIPNCWRVRK